MLIKIIKPIVSVAVFALVFSSTVFGQKKFIVNGYVGGFRGLVDTDAISAEKLTHINYAFVNVKDSMAVLTNLRTDSTNFRKLNNLKKINPDLKILISIGGWEWSENFSDAVLTESSRKLFAKSSAEIVKQYQLDGVDIDWEFPAMPGQADNIYRPEDKQNFTLMFEAIREELDKVTTETGKYYELTAAVGNWQNFVSNTEMDKVGEILDYVFLMTYDYPGRNRTIAHHTNLFPSKSALGGSVHESAKYFMDAGVPAEKLVLGAAFYGKAYESTTNLNSGLGQPWVANHGQGKARGQGGGFTEIKETMIDQNGYQAFWDEDARAPYLFNEESKVFVTYDDERSIREKVRYVQENNFAGLFFWEYFRDPKEYLLNTIHDELK